MIIAVVLFVLLILVGIDVGISMLAGGLLGMLLADIDPVMLPLTMTSAVDSSALVSIPLFVLAAEIMNRGGITERLVNWSLSLFGHARGALSQVAIGTNVLMAGISGSAVADATAIGRTLIPAMRAEGYPEGYAGAVIASGAMIGPIIPPSISLIIYAVMANESVLDMFMAALLPGLVLAAGFSAICWHLAVRRGYPARDRAAWTVFLTVSWSAAGALFMPVIILGGMRFGLLTDIEAAGVVALYALLLSCFVYRSVGVRQLVEVLAESARSAAVVLFMLAAAGPFSWLLAESKVNEALAGAILALTQNPIIGLLLINVLLLLVGCLVEPLPAMVIFVPSLLPVGVALGIDPVQFGIVIVINLMVGMLTPPVGLLLFVVSSVGRMSVRAMIGEIWPFLGWSVAVLVLMSLFPALVLWLPGTLR